MLELIERLNFPVDSNDRVCGDEGRVEVVVFDEISDGGGGGGGESFVVVEGVATNTVDGFVILPACTLTKDVTTESSFLTLEFIDDSGGGGIGNVVVVSVDSLLDCATVSRLFRISRKRLNKAVKHKRQPRSQHFKQKKLTSRPIMPPTTFAIVRGSVGLF